MIVQLPQGTTSLVLRLDGSGTEANVTLQIASETQGPTLTSGAAPRRRTMLACAALGAVAGAIGLSFWNVPARSEAVLNLPHQAAWNDGAVPRQADAMPAELAEQLARPPSVIPPIGTPVAPGAAAGPASSTAQTPAAGKNPFGLE
jgi:hypothetical protein